MMNSITAEIELEALPISGPSYDGNFDKVLPLEQDANPFANARSPPTLDASYPARDTSPEPDNAVSLPPMDSGFDAWAYLVGAFFIEFIVWSFPFSYGVFLNYYTTHTFKNSTSSSLAVVGSLSSGLLYLSSPLVLPVVNRYPWHKRNAMMLGVFLCVAGLVGAAFSTRVWQLIVTQGIIYPIGGSLLYFPMATFVFEWFSEKKGLANGVIFSGTGVGGVVTPLVVENLLNKYGQRTTLLSLAAAFLIISVPCFRYLKPRLPVAQVVGPRSINTQFITYSPFWILFIANLLQGLGSFLPTLYIPTFATDLNLSTASGTLALSLMNGASAPGLVFMGWLSDLLDVRFSIMLSSLGSGLAVLLLWGLAKSLAPLLAFSCIYGFLALSWGALWPRFVATADGDDPRQASTLMCIFVAGKGIGGVLSAPIASELLHPWYFTNKVSTGYGLKGYGPLIVFTGAALLVSCLGTWYRFFETKVSHQSGLNRREFVSAT